MMGHGSIRHNNREFTAANVDRERSGQNIVFVNEDLKQTYNNLFGEALEAYNAGKKDKRQDPGLLRAYPAEQAGEAVP